MKDKIKVVWIANFSNQQVREKLVFRVSLIERLVRRLMHTVPAPVIDYGQWVTNGIREFEKFDDVDLHIIAPESRLARKESRFEINGIHYYIFKDEVGTDIEFIKRNLIPGYICAYKKNQRRIVSLIRTLNPDIVHMIGAENLSYVYSLSGVPSAIPTIVQLQTLMSAPSFKEGADMTEIEYYQRVKGEQFAIRKANYVGTGGIKFLPIIRTLIKPDVKALVMPLALAETICLEGDEQKEFDFIYFAKNISKAADWAIEAFALFNQKHPGMTLHIVGYYSEDYRRILDCRLQELGILDQVFFEGELSTHEDVISRIRKARVALLPLKVDLVSGTIREAMANGIPVVTTITPGTPGLNEKRKSVLLSEKEDFQGMADNMIKVIDDPMLMDTLIKNAAITLLERADNYSRMRTTVEVYKACIDNFRRGVPIPEGLIRK